MMKHDELLYSGREWFALARYLLVHLPTMLPLSRKFLKLAQNAEYGRAA